MCCEIIIIPAVICGSIWLLCVFAFIHLYRKKMSTRIEASKLEFEYTHDTEIHLGNYQNNNNINNTNNTNNINDNEKLV
jgi:hypothetical protein